MKYGATRNMTEPLLKSEGSYEVETEDNEIFNTEEKPSIQYQKRTRRQVIAFLSLAGAIALVGAATYFFKPSPQPPLNVILLISDGFGPASETYSRTYYQTVKSLPYWSPTPLDSILVGTSRTRSSNSLVTDSAAGATAFSCAQKSYNAAIGVTPAKTPCGTILEAAKLGHGMLTGLVVTSRITHATPASFSAHVLHRDMEGSIAEQQIGDYPLGRVVDLAFGGGRCFFLSNTTEGSCRPDDKELWAKASDYGWKNLLKFRDEFDRLEEGLNALPALGLFTLDHMSYEIDRNPSLEPSLNEMATKALRILSKASEGRDQGFFLMIEGSRIDMAAHSNDPAAHAHDILAYQDTIETVKSFVDTHPGTVMISVSDHETGGFTLGRQTNLASYPEYLWYPEVLTRVKNSSLTLQQIITRYNSSDKEQFVRETIIKDRLGIDDATDEEVQDILNGGRPEYMGGLDSYLSNMTSFRAQLGWTTHGHSGVDVNLYAYGKGAENLRGNHENTDIGKFIVNFLNLDLSKITERLNKDASFTKVGENKIVKATDGLQHYHSHSN